MNTMVGAWRGGPVLLELYTPFLSISFASEVSESGAGDLLGCSRWELAETVGLGAEGDTGVVGLSG